MPPEQSGPAKGFARFVVCHGGFAADHHDCHLGAVFAMPTNRALNSARFFDFAVHQRQILTPRAARLQLPHQMRLRLRSFGDHHHPAGVLVEPVHDAGARHIRQRGRMMQQGIEQRAIAIACTGVNDEPRRLVDDQQMLVLEDDVERNVFADGLNFALGPRQCGHDRLAALEF